MHSAPLLGQGAIEGRHVPWSGLGLNTHARDDIFAGDDDPSFPGAYGKVSSGDTNAKGTAPGATVYSGRGWSAVAHTLAADMSNRKSVVDTALIQSRGPTTSSCVGDERMLAQCFRESLLRLVSIVGDEQQSKTTPPHIRASSSCALAHGCTLQLYALISLSLIECTDRR